MTEIAYPELDAHFAGLPSRQTAPLYLVYGEEMLCQKAIRAIVDRISGPAAALQQVDRIEGTAPGAVAEALARVNTYSLLGDPKVVFLADTTVFEAGLDTRAYLEKARSCLEKNEPAKASKALMAVLAFQQIDLVNVDAETRRQLLAAAEMDPGDDTWLETLLEHCRDQTTGPPSAEDDADVLARAIERGFPAGNHLLLSTSGVDRRRKLYKTILAAGIIIDASVPTGGRRADLETQQRLLQDQVRRILTPSGKHLGSEAYGALVEMTGFDLRTFCTSLEKLVDYVGPRSQITADDVRQVLKRSKVDPIYALTGAAGDRRLDQALVFLDSILDAGLHPLQVLAALTNLVRRLILARSFIDSSEGRCWQPKTAYNDFQRQVLPVVLAHDRRLDDRMRAWRADPADAPAKRQSKTDSDLALVKNPKSVYPVFQLFRQAEGFSQNHLEAIVHRLCEADRAVKTSAATPRWVIESLLWFICEGSAPQQQRK